MLACEISFVRVHNDKRFQPGMPAAPCSRQPCRCCFLVDARRMMKHYSCGHQRLKPGRPKGRVCRCSFHRGSVLRQVLECQKPRGRAGQRGRRATSHKLRGCSNQAAIDVPRLRRAPIAETVDRVCRMDKPPWHLSHRRADQQHAWSTHPSRHHHRAQSA